MPIKLVAIDIDGTLINDQRKITPQTVATIKIPIDSFEEL